MQHEICVGRLAQRVRLYAASAAVIVQINPQMARCSEADDFQSRTERRGNAHRQHSRADSDFAGAVLRSASQPSGGIFRP